MMAQEKSWMPLGGSATPPYLDGIRQQKEPTLVGNSARTSMHPNAMGRKWILMNWENVDASATKDNDAQSSVLL